MASNRSDLISILLALGLTGCSFTTMQTSRQLDKGEVVYSGALDLPGFLYIPRASAQAMYGFGTGDIGAHLGTSLVLFNGGVSGRAYVTPWLTAGLQSDFMLFPGLDFFNGPGGDGDFSGLLTLSPRLTTATIEGDLLYGGLQSNLIFATSPGYALEFTGVFVGLIGGLEYVITDKVAIQAELTVSPLYVDTSGANFIFDQGGGFAFQMGLGVNWGTGRGATPPPTRTTPTPQVNPPPQDPRGTSTIERSAPEAPAPVSSPDPVYDDDGVPLY
jgi:hypothetical protein